MTREEQKQVERFALAVAIFAGVTTVTILGLTWWMQELRKENRAQAELISEHAEIMQFWINQLDAQG
jgi:hypothetical protein